MLSNTFLQVQLSEPSTSSIQKPEVLTSEVLVFFALLAFLAVFGFRKGS